MVPALLLLDAHGVPLRPSIQQNDARATDEIAELRREIDQSRLFQLTGGVTNQQHIGPRVRWLQRHEPDAWTQARTLCGSYDYLVFRLTGERSLERNWAIESGLYDLRADAWLPDQLRIAGIDPTQLPPVRDPAAVVGGITQRAADAIGLRAGTPVIAGSADHVASALAAGLRREGDLLIKFGGAGDILYCADRLLTDPAPVHRPPRYSRQVAAERLHGGQWLTRQMVRDVDPRTDGKRGHAPRTGRGSPGSAGGVEGLVILPYFVGEKTPIMDPQARGVFFGLSLHHQRGRTCFAPSSNR